MVKILNIFCKVIACDFNEAVNLLSYKNNNDNSVKIVSFVNSHAINLCFENSEFYNNLLSSDFLFRDGVGVAIGMRLFGIPCGYNNNGTDLIPKIIEEYSDKVIVILGSEDKVFAKANKKIKSLFNIYNIHYLNGFDYSYNEYLSFVNDVEPDLIILAMGMPKQELLSKYLKDNVCFSSLVINGGAVLSFMSGDEIRAPKVIRFLSLEWLWRFANDPVRLFKRYFVGNLIYFFKLFFARFMGRVK